VTPLPAVLALWDSWVHVCTPDGSDVVANIKAPVDEHFSLLTTLYIPYIDSDYCHVGFRGDLDYSWLQRKCDVVKNVVLS